MIDLALYGIATVIFIAMFYLHKNPDKNAAALRKVKSTLKFKRWLFNRGSRSARSSIDSKSSSFDQSPEPFPSVSAMLRALQTEGFTSCPLIIGVDYTASNEWQGRFSWKRESLHILGQPKGGNPYQRVLGSLARTLSPLCSGAPVYLYGFGGSHCSAFPLNQLDSNELPVPITLADVPTMYNAVTSRVELGGRTNYAVMIRKAINIARTTGKFHILVIIGDCQLNGGDDAAQMQVALAEASAYPMSVIVIGVGDGPFNLIARFDEETPNSRRQFDNLHFVNYHQAAALASKSKNGFDVGLALACLTEVPQQYRKIKDMGYLPLTQET